MAARFIHTADWQIGKPYASNPSPTKRVLAQQERLNVIGRIGAAAQSHNAQFVLVAGDLFDSTTPSKDDVAALCTAICQIGLPVHVIPGNHDHGGPGGVWHQPFFRDFRAQQAPNLHIHLEPAPIILPDAVLLPCPLRRRHENADTCAWLRACGSMSEKWGEKPRIVLAHGSVQGFSSDGDDESNQDNATNRIELERLQLEAFDYIALGDWHGAKQISEKAWYAGTPEQDRFAKGADYQAGYVLAVVAERAALPQVSRIKTGRFGWHELSFHLAEDAALGILRQAIEGLLGNRAQSDLLNLTLTGSLGIEVSAQLAADLEAWKARLIR